MQSNHELEDVPPNLAPFLNRIKCGDARQVLSTFPENSIDCVITSPPYFQQRDYQHRAQIGQENSPQEYVDQLVSVFREVRRILKPTGTFWLNLGDKFKAGNLLGMPWRVALSLMDEGWFLRNEVIWHKPNAMPTSAKNRLTVDHETIFFFVKSSSYFYDADAIREPHITFSEKSRMKGGRNHFGKRGGTPEKGKNSGNSNLHDGRWDQAFHPAGRNRRTVWTIPLSKFREAHFAVFPEVLVENCVKAGCPENGIVLDPFCGSATTLKVGAGLGRRYIGVDCSTEYCQMARRRLKAVDQ